MAVRKLTTGKWLCECYPAGRSGRRVRKQFATKGEALAFERHTMEETEAKPWLGESVDRRTLKDVVELWFKLHGKSLTAGQHVYDKLLLMVDALGNPLATDLTSKMFAHYRDKRLTGEIYFSEKWKKGASPVTINLEQSYLSSVFSELSRLGEWSYPNPLENMRKFTIAEKEMAWLTHEQIVELLADCKPSVICMAIQIHTLTLVIYTVKMLSTGGHFLWLYENSPQENGFANVTPPDVVGVVCVNNSPPKAKHWLLSVTRWKKPKQSPGWVNQWIVEH